MTTEPGQEKAGWPVVALIRRTEDGKLVSGTVPPRAEVRSDEEIATYFPESAITGLVNALEEISAKATTSEAFGPGPRNWTAVPWAAENADNALSAFKQDVG